MDDLAGRSLGPYRVSERIGTGGMAAVYRGVHVALGQPRAIKILLPAHAEDASLVERFRIEAQIASGLRHPNIVSIYDVGEQDGLFYLVMDLVEGTSLGRLLRHESRLDLGRATHMLAQLASALDYAHGAGVVHRDVKPGNVVVGTNDHVSLLDFGVARISGVLNRLTNPGQLVGTPEYLAPEVITGAEGDRRSDYYGLGVLAFQMLTGKLPFGGDDTMALLYAQVNAPPPSLRETRPELPEAVDRVVMRQLSKTPEARYRTATGFVQALIEATGDLQPVPPSPGAGPFAPATLRPGSGVEASAQRPTPDAPDEWFTTLPAAFLAGEADAATPRPQPLPSTVERRSAPAASDRHAAPSGFDQRAATIPPPSSYGPEPAPPEPRHQPAGSQQPVVTGPDDRAGLVLQQRALPRAADAEAQGTRSIGPAVVAMAIIGLIIWALATGRFWTMVGLDPTPVPVPEQAAAAPTRAATATMTRPTVDAASAGVAAGAPGAAPISASPAPAGAPPAADASSTAEPQVAAAPAGASQPTSSVVPAVAAARPSPPSPEQQLQTASSQIASGEYAQAVSALKALKASASDTEGVDDALYQALLGLGQQQREQGLLDDSYATYGEALTLRPDDPAALDGQQQVVLAKLWDTMEAAWDQDEAVASAALEEIMTLDPGYRDANQKLYALLVTRANRLIEAGDVEGALVALRRARDVYPEGDEARRLIVEHTPHPTPTTPPTPAQQAPAPVSKPATEPATKPEQKPERPITLPQAPSSLPQLPKPGGLPGLPIP